MQLIVAEKPSVARDLARVLGVPPHGQGSFRGPDHVITWCIGHLVELIEPHEYDAAWKSWRMATLPMIPETFRLRAARGTADQWTVVRGLLRSREFTEVINACDAGREGELIFRYCYELSGSRLPMRRLWISSMTDTALRAGLARLRTGAQMDPLADAARSRSEADWLVGLNATRAFTIAQRGASDGSVLFTVGRVQTPTLAIVVEREKAIESFVPRDYWEVSGAFRLTQPDHAARGTRGANPLDVGARTFVARWQSGSVARLGTAALAESVIARASSHPSPPTGPRVESVDEKKTREPAPLLFDLTSLQRTANRRFGMSAQHTLDIAQALYERHKLLTYPRTDSRYLTTDIRAEVPGILAALSSDAAYATFSTHLLAHPPPASLPRVFNDAQVSDHHAIIPTAKAPGGSLSVDERRIYDLVVRRFLGVFYPDAEFAVTVVTVVVGAVSGVATGTTVHDGDGGARETPTPRRPHANVADGDGIRSETALAPRSHENAGRRTPRPGAVGDTTRSGDRATAREGDRPEAEDETILDALPPPPDRFVARGRVRLVAGWHEPAGMQDRSSRPGSTSTSTSTSSDVASRTSDGAASRSDVASGRDPGGDQDLPRVTVGDVLTGRYEALAKRTRPPPRYTEASLLGAMESAGKSIDDEALRQAMRDCGLGTPATRASILETLIRRTFLVRDAKNLVPTPLGRALIDRLPVRALVSAELTGDWEARLARMARGEDSRRAFMTAIHELVNGIVEAFRHAPPPESLPAGVVTSRPSDYATRPSSSGRAGGSRKGKPRGSAPRTDASTRTPRGRIAPPRETSGEGRASRTTGRGDDHETTRPKSRPRASSASPRGTSGSTPRKPSTKAISRATRAPSTEATEATHVENSSPAALAPRVPFPSGARPPTRTPATTRTTETPGTLKTPATMRATDATETHGTPRTPGTTRATETPGMPGTLKTPRSSDRAPTTPGAVLDLGCPLCRQGRLITGHRAWGCTRFREGCRLVIPFRVGERALSDTQVRDLVERGRTRPSTWTVNGASMRGRLVMTFENGATALDIEPAG